MKTKSKVEKTKEKWQVWLVKGIGEVRDCGYGESAEEAVEVAREVRKGNEGWQVLIELV